MSEEKKKDSMPDAVPYIAHEDAMVRNERLVKRLIICLITSIILMFVTNAIWIYWWNQYDTVSYDQDGSGINNINTGGQGDVKNEPKVTGENQKESEEREGSSDSKE